MNPDENNKSLDTNKKKSHGLYFFFALKMHRPKTKAEESTPG
jgi:hypothetical protein